MLRLEVQEEKRLQENTIIWHLYLLNHDTYEAIKFEVNASNGLGGDTFTRNMIDRCRGKRTDERRADFGTFKSKEKSRYNKGNKIMYGNFIYIAKGKYNHWNSEFGLNWMMQIIAVPWLWETVWALQTLKSLLFSII